MTYAELLQYVQDYLQNTETSFVTNIPFFVKQAEERINRTVMIPDLRKSSSGTTTASDRYLSKPSDFLSVFSISVEDGSGNDEFLLLKEENFIREAYPDVTTEGQPLYYAHFDDDFFLLAPTPDDAYTVNLRYYHDPQSIVDAGSSWLGTNAESLLLYGTLVEAYRYEKGDPEMMKMYQTAYDEALEHLIKLGTLRMKRDDYRGGEIRAEP